MCFWSLLLLWLYHTVVIVKNAVTPVNAQMCWPQELEDLGLSQYVTMKNWHLGKVSASPGSPYSRQLPLAASTGQLFEPPFQAPSAPSLTAVMDGLSPLPTIWSPPSGAAGSPANLPHLPHVAHERGRLWIWCQTPEFCMWGLISVRPAAQQQQQHSKKPKWHHGNPGIQRETLASNNQHPH